MAIWALICSVVGCLFPVGIGLAFKARADIRRRNEEGDVLAVAALIVGFLYLAVIVIGLIVYWWIKSGS